MLRHTACVLHILLYIWPWRASWAAGRAWASYRSPPTCSGAVSCGLSKRRKDLNRDDSTESTNHKAWLTSRSICQVPSQPVCAYECPGLCRLKASLQRVQWLMQGPDGGFTPTPPILQSCLCACHHPSHDDECKVLPSVVTACVYIPGVCRLKASLQRVQRLTQGFTDGLLSLFPDRANALGAALGIQAERIQVRRCPCWI